MFEYYKIWVLQNLNAFFWFFEWKLKPFFIDLSNHLLFESFTILYRLPRDLKTPSRFTKQFNSRCTFNWFETLQTWYYPHARRKDFKRLSSFSPFKTPFLFAFLPNFFLLLNLILDEQYVIFLFTLHCSFF